PAALQHLLRALPRSGGQRARHGGRARLPAADRSSRRSRERPTGRRDLQRHHERRAQHAFVSEANPRRGSLGDRDVGPRARAQPARERRGCARGLARKDRAGERDAMSSKKEKSPLTKKDLAQKAKPKKSSVAKSAEGGAEAAPKKAQKVALP